MKLLFGRILLVGVSVALAGGELRAAATAADSAVDATYNAGWNNGSNGGSGWGGAWQLGRSSNDNAVAGFIVGDSATNGSGDPGTDGDINTPTLGGRAWGMYANSGQNAQAFRLFNGALIVGQSFRIDLDSGSVNTGGTNGFALRNGANEERFQFYLAGGDSQYRIVDNSGGARATSIPSTDQGLRLTFTLTGLNTYSVVIDGVGTDAPPGVLPATITGALAGTPDSGIIRLRVFDLDAGPNADHNLFINSISLNCNNLPTTAAANTSPVCVGQPLNLTATGDGSDTYSWNGPAGFSSSLQNPSILTVALTNSGNYIVTRAQNGCVSAPASTLVSVTAAATVTVTNNGPVCTGDQLRLQANGPAGGSYFWTGPNLFTSPLQNPVIDNAGSLNAGQYCVQVTVSNCASAQACTTVAVTGSPTTQASNNGPVCRGEALQLFATGVGSFNWTGPNGFTSTTQNPTITNVQPNAAGTYLLTVTQGTCTSPAATTTVVVAALPLTAASNNGPLCRGETLQLTAAGAGGDIYQWSGPNGFFSAIQSPVLTNVQPSQSGPYCVTRTVGSCASTQSCTPVVINPVPTTVASNSSPACLNSTVRLFAPGNSADQYLWTGPGTFTSTNQNPILTNVGTNSIGSYSVVRTANGCSSPASITEVVLTPIPATSAGNNGPLCIGDDLQLTATGLAGDSYSWTGPNGYVADTQNPVIPGVTAANAGDYFVRRVAGGVCTSVVVKTTVKVNIVPACSIDGADAFCAGTSGESYFGPAGAGLKYFWTITNNVAGVFIDGSRAEQSVSVAMPGNVRFPATFTLSLKVTAGTCVNSGACTKVVTVNPTPVLLPDILEPAGVGAPYVQLLTVDDGFVPATPYDFTVSGTLPPGLSFTAGTTNAVISGIATTVGNSTFGITVTNANGCSSTRAYTLGVVTCLSLTVQPQALPNPSINVPYSESVTSPTGALPVQFVLVGGQLPTGITLTSAGLLSGTPTAFGTFSFELLALDANGCQGSRFYTVKVGCPVFSVGPGSLPSGGIGIPYGQTITATGGTAPYTYSIVSGSLPTGLTLSSAGQISGTPASGSTVFTVRATDAKGCFANASYVVIINLNGSTLVLTPTSLPNGTAGTSYNQPITATGGTEPISYAITSGALPAGLTLATDGTLAGTPTTSGLFGFVVTATDANGHTGAQGYSLNIVCTGISLSALAVNSGGVRQSYSQTITATGGAAPFGFAINTGALPPGLFLTVAGNVATIAGSPTTVGNYGFTLAVTDAAGCLGSNAYSIAINNATVNLGLTKVGSPDSVVVGSNVIYTVVVTNSGPSAAIGVSVTDPLPSQLGFVAASPGCALVGSSVVCPIGTLNVGASTTLTVQVTTLVDGLVTNTATVTGLDPDLNGVDNSATAVTTVTLVPTLGLSAATAFLSVEDGAAVLRVSRTGNADLAVTVGYATTDGTAVAGTDYTATAGVLSFGPGVTSQTVVVPLLNNSAAAGKNLKLQLNSPAGGVLADGGTETVISLVAAASAKQYSFIDQDGDRVTLEIRGKGRMDLGLVGANNGPIDRVGVRGSDARSRLIITVLQTAGGDGRVTINRIVADADLRSIEARDADLIGGGVDVAGYLGSVTVRDVLQGAGVTALGSATQSTRVKAHLLGNGTALQFGSGVRSLVAAQFGAGEVTAPCLGKITMKGDRALGIAATSAAKLTIANGRCKP